MGLLPDVFGDKLEIDGRHYLMCLPAESHAAPANDRLRETYQKVRGLLEAGDLDIRETYTAQERALGAAGWDDPALDAYN